MTDRYFALTVVLQDNIRSDDAANIINAISMIKGVLNVSPHVADVQMHVAEERARIVGRSNDCDISTTTWVKVKDKLPKNNEYVLCTDGKDIYILQFHQSQDKRYKNPTFYFESHLSDCFDEITHWMPLPEPPKN